MKRFTDTEQWFDPWFRPLPPKLKCFWHFICSRCDNSGVWKPDFDLASFCIGEPISESEVLAAFGKRIEVLKDGWWIVKFIEFQYGELSQHCKPHAAVLILLKKHCIGYPKGINTLQEKDRDKEKDKDKEKEGVGDARGRGFPATVEAAVSACDRIAVPPDFVAHCYAKGASRGGLDARGQSIDSFPHYALVEWKYEQDRLAREKLNGKSKSLPEPKQSQETLHAPIL